MASKVYTAVEMRSAASYVETYDVFEDHDREIADMLRQAADMMEREEESDVVRCKKCQTERTGEGYGDVPPHVGEDDVCDRCEIAEHLRRGKDADERERKKNYEYVARYISRINGESYENFGKRYDTEEEVMENALRSCCVQTTIMRRTVGEWEEVPNEK